MPPDVWRFYPDALSIFLLSSPCEYMPWSTIPVECYLLAFSNVTLLPSAPNYSVGFHFLFFFLQKLILLSTTIHFSGLNTEPVSLLHPASNSRYRVCPRISLLICWLGFIQMGIGSCSLTHWVTSSNFKGVHLLPTIWIKLDTKFALLADC